MKISEVESSQEYCVYCKKSVKMHHIPYIITTHAGGREYTEHKLIIEQCDLCKMIQPKEE